MAAQTKKIKKGMWDHRSTELELARNVASDAANQKQSQDESELKNRKTDAAEAQKKADEFGKNTILGNMWGQKASTLNDSVAAKEQELSQDKNVARHYNNATNIINANANNAAKKESIEANAKAAQTIQEQKKDKTGKGTAEKITGGKAARIKDPHEDFALTTAKEEYAQTLGKKGTDIKDDDENFKKWIQSKGAGYKDQLKSKYVNEKYAFDKVKNELLAAGETEVSDDRVKQELETRRKNASYESAKERLKAEGKENPTDAEIEEYLKKPTSYQSLYAYDLRMMDQYNDERTAFGEVKENFIKEMAREASITALLEQNGIKSNDPEFAKKKKEFVKNHEKEISELTDQKLQDEQFRKGAENQAGFIYSQNPELFENSARELAERQRIRREANGDPKKERAGLLKLAFSKKWARSASTAALILTGNLFRGVPGMQNAILNTTHKLMMAFMSPHPMSVASQSMAAVISGIAEGAEVIKDMNKTYGITDPDNPYSKNLLMGTIKGAQYYRERDELVKSLYQLGTDFERELAPYGGNIDNLTYSQASKVFDKMSTKIDPEISSLMLKEEQDRIYQEQGKPEKMTHAEKAKLRALRSVRNRIKGQRDLMKKIEDMDRGPRFQQEMNDLITASGIPQIPETTLQNINQNEVLYAKEEAYITNKLDPELIQLRKEKKTGELENDMRYAAIQSYKQTHKNTGDKIKAIREQQNTQIRASIESGLFYGLPTHNINTMAEWEVERVRNNWDVQCADKFNKLDGNTSRTTDEQQEYAILKELKSLLEGKEKQIEEDKDIDHKLDRYRQFENNLQTSNIEMLSLHDKDNGGADVFIMHNNTDPEGFIRAIYEYDAEGIVSGDLDDVKKIKDNAPSKITGSDGIPYYVTSGVDGNFSQEQSLKKRLERFESNETEILNNGVSKEDYDRTRKMLIRYVQEVEKEQKKYRSEVTNLENDEFFPSLRFGAPLTAKETYDFDEWLNGRSLNNKIEVVFNKLHTMEVAANNDPANFDKWDQLKSLRNFYQVLTVKQLKKNLERVISSKSSTLTEDEKDMMRERFDKEYEKYLVEYDENSIRNNTGDALRFQEGPNVDDNRKAFEDFKMLTNMDIASAYGKDQLWLEKAKVQNKEIMDQLKLMHFDIGELNKKYYDALNAHDTKTMEQCRKIANIINKITTGGTPSRRETDDLYKYVYLSNMDFGKLSNDMNDYYFKRDPSKSPNEYNDIIYQMNITKDMLFKNGFYGRPIYGDKNFSELLGDIASENYSPDEIDQKIEAFFLKTVNKESISDEIFDQIKFITGTELSPSSDLAKKIFDIKNHSGYDDYRYDSERINTFKEEIEGLGLTPTELDRILNIAGIAFQHQREKLADLKNDKDKLKSVIHRNAADIHGVLSNYYSKELDVTNPTYTDFKKDVKDKVRGFFDNFGGDGSKQTRLHMVSEINGTLMQFGDIRYNELEMYSNLPRGVRGAKLMSKTPTELMDLLGVLNNLEDREYTSHVEHMPREMRARFYKTITNAKELSEDIGLILKKYSKKNPDYDFGELNEFDIENMKRMGKRIDTGDKKLNSDLAKYITLVRKGNLKKDKLSELSNIANIKTYNIYPALGALYDEGSDVLESFIDDDDVISKIYLEYSDFDPSDRNKSVNDILKYMFKTTNKDATTLRLAEKLYNKLQSKTSGGP